MPNALVAQEWVKPIPGETLLSGNFGELRATHLHAGIDIRTGGVEGLPVRCVQDGTVSRVSVSPTGYGLALYVDHPDGTTTVYGHLQRFEPRIAAVVRELQYARESFRIDEHLLARGIRYRRGDTIAFSGNTGSSGGPHLHFEVRDTRTGHTINPLRYYSVRDALPPQVKSLRLYALSPEGCVDHLRACALKQTAPGRYDAGCHALPAGRIGVGAFVIDYMDGSRNKLGVYRLVLTAGADTLYHLTMDSCAFRQDRCINDLKDYHRYRLNETVYRCFGNRQGELFAVDMRGDGAVLLEADAVVPLTLAFDDINGNRSVVTATLRGIPGECLPGKGQGASVAGHGEEASPFGVSPASPHILRYGCPHELACGGWRVGLGRDALFTSVERRMHLTVDTLSGIETLSIAPAGIPLYKKARLTLRGCFSPKTLLCEISPLGRRHPLATRHAPDSLTAEVSTLSRYTTVTDTIAPDIAYVGRAAGQTLRFKAEDDCSGIADWRGEVNGAWCLFSYDPRTGILQCSLREPVFRRGVVNTVTLTVTDKVNNSKQITKQITL